MQLDQGKGTTRKVIILGGGCAGWTAAIYTARADLQPLLITGNDLGGQLATTTEVENYPGFPDGILGPELMQRLQQQAEKFGTEVVMDLVTEVDFQQRPFVLKTLGETYRAQAVIIATGASPRKLGVPGEKELLGYGVSYCATCDGFFFRGQTIAVVGGGDSAAEESTYLTRFAEKVYLIHRRDRLRASEAMQRRVLANEKIEPVWDTVVTEVLGSPGERMTGLKIKNVKTEEESTLPVTGLFVAIGHVPNSQIFEGQLELDPAGYILTDPRMHTSVPGVFAAGDVVDHVFMQAVTAAGMGCAAAIEAERYMASLEDRAYPSRG